MKIDGSFTDIATLLVAVLYVFVRHSKCHDKKWAADNFIADLLHGASLFPMILLSFTFLSSTALELLTNGNKLIISLAGIVSIVVLLKGKLEK